jgi:anti-sigma-K factor RskA
MKCPGFPLETYGFHALGLLEDEEREEIDRHLREGCETCIEGVRLCAETWHSVAFSAPDVRPPRSLRNKVIRSIANEPEHWWERPMPLVTSMGLAVLALTLGSVYFVRRPSPTIAPVPPVVTAVTPPTAVPNAAAPPETRTVASPTPSPAPLVVTDPAQAQLLVQVRQELERERERSARLEADLQAESDRVASAQRTLQDSERRYLALASQTNTPPVSTRAAEIDELTRQVAALNVRIADLNREVEQYRTLLQLQRKQVDSYVQLASLVSAPALHVVRLRGTEKGKEIVGHALFTAGDQMVFYASQLPALQANRRYQLWLLRGKSPAIASAGLFDADRAGSATVQFRDRELLTSVTAMAVTDEPAGGSPLPTGHKWMVGTAGF